MNPKYIGIIRGIGLSVIGHAFGMDLWHQCLLVTGGAMMLCTLQENR